MPDARQQSRVTWRAGLAAMALALVAIAGYVVWQASRALRESAARVESGSDLRFTVTRLDRNAAARPGSSASGFESIGSPAVFNDAQPFHGALYLSGPSGLFAYDAKGALEARYRVGQELPASPLVGLATGVAAGASDPELFIATSGEGLLAYDGRAFRQIRAEDAPYRRLTAVLPLETGRILLGTEKKGLLVYDGKRLALFHPALTDIHVTALAGTESSLWVGTLDRGVWHWHAGQIDRFAEGEGLPDPQVLSLATQGDSAYIGTPLGVAEFRDGKFTRVLASGTFARSLLMRGETLTVGTLDEGTFEIPLGAPAVRPAASLGVPRLAVTSPRGAVERVFEMEGKLYALADDGLYAVDDHAGEWRRVIARGDALLTDRNVSALAVDAAGKLWVGYFDRGLDMVTGVVGPGEGRASHVENEHVFCVNRIVPDPDRGVVDVATANGLVLFDVAGNERQVLGRRDGLISDHVTDVLVRPEGMVAATPAGLTFVDSSGMRSLYAFQGLVNNHVYALAASGNRLLAGTLGGLSVFDQPGGSGAPAGPVSLGDAVVRANYTTTNSGLKHNWITAIVPVGEDWFVGTYGAGVLRLTASGHWQTFPDAGAPLVVNPNAMLVTTGRVYAGTLDRGLCVYDRASGRWTIVTAGLPSLNVTALTAHEGVLYVGTDNGLVRIAEQSLSVE